MKTAPVIEVNLDTYFDKESIVLVLTNFQKFGCTFYHLSDQEKDPKLRIPITLETAAEYLYNALNREPNIFGILCKYKDKFIVLSLFNSSPFYSSLSLRISDLGSKDDIRPWILFLMDVTHGAPISFISTITDGSSCEWEYGQIAESKKLREIEKSKSS